MRDALVQVLGLVFLIVPLIAVQWNLAGNKRRGSSRFLPGRDRHRWRLEIYSSTDDVEGALVDRADIPFPVKQVTSARGRLAQRPGANAWALPRLELDVDIDDPFTDEALAGLFGADHQLRYVTGNDAVLDTANRTRVRVRALAFR